MPYVRAFLNVFFPDVAKEAGIPIVEPSDGDCVQCEAEAVISILSIAIGAGDWSRQQFCHERLFQLAIFAAGKKAAAEHVESVCSELYAQLEVQQQAARRNKTEVPTRRKNKPPRTDKDAAAIQQHSIANQKCNTLGLRELCAVSDDGKPNKVLSQLVRIAQTSDPGSDMGLVPIKWGEKCSCGPGRVHAPGCWKNVSDIYWFLDNKCMHIYVHQMWLEGAFNVLNYSNHNSGEDLQESNLLNNYNHFSNEYVAPEVIDEHARKIKKAKQEAYGNMQAREEAVIASITDKSKGERKAKASTC